MHTFSRTLTKILADRALSDGIWLEQMESGDPIRRELTKSVVAVGIITAALVVQLVVAAMNGASGPTAGRRSTAKRRREAATVSSGPVLFELVFRRRHLARQGAGTLSTSTAEIQYAVMLVLILGLGLKAKFCGLGLGLRGLALAKNSRPKST